MKMYTVVLVILLLMIIIPDYFFYRKLRDNRIKPIFILLHLLFPIFFSALFIYIKVGLEEMHNFRVVWWIMWLYFVFLLIYIPKILHIITYIIKHFYYKKHGKKLRFLAAIRIVISTFIVAFMLYSAYVTPKNYEVNNFDIPLKNLPPSFDGFKIVQFSDIHLGSWNSDYSRMDKIIELINEQKADMIVFTGDMVNNFATESCGWDTCFLKLNAQYAKLAILGNHDYGDYTHWRTEFDRDENRRKIRLAIERAGFQLLLNENVAIKNDSEDSIFVAGVENWGKSEQFRYSKLSEAIIDIPDSVPVILLSHDPNHWDAEVLENQQIALTLAGHTHAAQMGFTIAKKLFTPASFVFKRYAGLYQEGNQYLYVNRGVGYIGLPMQLGTRPEISVFTLRCVN